MEFIAKAKPLILAIADDLRDAPTIPELRARGFGWVVSALRRHGMVYPELLQACGLNSSCRTQPGTPNQRPWRYWQQPGVVETTLQRDFPELWRWGILPSFRQLNGPFPGLVKHLRAKHKTFAAAAKHLGLTPYETGKRHRLYVENILWSLEYFQKSLQWPTATKCPWRLRSLRFRRGVSWKSFCQPQNLPPQPSMILIEGMQRFVEWGVSNGTNEAIFFRHYLEAQKVLISHSISPPPA